MNHIETIHVELTEIQIKVIEQLRSKLPYYTDEDFQGYLVALGIISLGMKDLDDSSKWTPEEDSAAPPHRSVGDHVTFRVPDDLRPRLERLLTMCPELGNDEFFSSLVDLAIETLVELRVIRGKDVALLPKLEGHQ